MESLEITKKQTKKNSRELDEHSPQWQLPGTYRREAPRIITQVICNVKKMHAGWWGRVTGGRDGGMEEIPKKGESGGAIPQSQVLCRNSRIDLFLLYNSNKE